MAEDETNQEVTRIIQEAPSTQQEAQTLEANRKEEMRRLMEGMKTARERIGNFCTVIPVDPDIPSSQEAIVLPIGVGDRSTNKYGYGRTIIISENGYEYTDGSSFEADFGDAEIRPQQDRKLVYRTFDPSEVPTNPVSHRKMAGHVLSVVGTEYGDMLQRAEQKDVLDALKTNITKMQLRNQPTIDRAKADIATSQSVTRILTDNTK